MDNDRLSVFDNTEDVDLTGFTPQPKSRKPKPPMAKVKAVTEAARFPSREAAPPAVEPLKHRPRYHKTGRTAQLNCRVTPASFEKVYEIADRQGWKIGQTVELAIEALEQALLERKGEGTHGS